MPKPPAPITTHSTPETPPPPPLPHADRPDLPEELLPLHEEYGAWWVLSYQPLCPTAPYTARPRAADGADRRPQTLRTDTVSMLARVLDAAASEKYGEEGDDGHADAPAARTPPPAALGVGDRGRRDAATRRAAGGRGTRWSG
ncbi:hypothetical protein EKD16_10015 [Streptomonospora litoralis]|uniref:Uncharacterized protein n=1 Tax=Streptomonospora litoralis TaxID=2498135 RepID=A0A4P6Q3F7_9ACTN|nr:hypothetical protein EKD16_10015 [Streptomonospora litoralis]